MLLTDLGINTAGPQLGWPSGSSAQPPSSRRASRAAIADQTTAFDSTVNFGLGDAGVMINADKEFPYVVAYGQSGPLNTFIVCNETIEMVSQTTDDKFLTIDWLLGSSNDDGVFGLWVPQGCTPINLVPECDVLVDEQGVDPRYHELANEVRCYQNVSAIDWN